MVDEGSEVVAAMTTETASRRSSLVRQFSKQIAGHSKEKGSFRPGMLKHADGSLLKPILGPPRGPRELNFYQDIFDSRADDDDVTLELRKFVPHFRGFLRIDDPGGDEYLKLEDLTENLRSPCILDVKMGSRTYDAEAPPEKILKETEKYKGTKTLGFCIPGMRVHQVSTLSNVCHGKQFGKRLDENTVKDAIRFFLNCECPASRGIVDGFLHQLDAVRRWFERQRRYVFYASSLLLVYDAAQLVDGQVQSNGDDRSAAVVSVRMIDFAHVFPSTTVDENYLYGLNNLIKLLEELRNSNV